MSDDATIIDAIVLGGESYYAELKGAYRYSPSGRKPRGLKDVARDIAEAVAAFANSDGGDLLVGVEDNGDVTGVPWDGDRLRFLLQVPLSHVDSGSEIGVQPKDVTYRGETVLWFRVQEHADTPVVTADGRCLERRKASTVPVRPAEIERRRRHRIGDLGYEATPVPRATVDDLDLELLNLAVDRALPKARFSDESGALRYWNLIERRNGSIVLRRAALLLFAKEPLRWHANNRMRIRRVVGSDEGFGRDLRTREVEVDGPIVPMFRRASRRLRRDLEVEARHDSLFSTSNLLPRDAAEECLVNAIVHRNYAIDGQAIEVLIYPDRVEFCSPGALPGPITIEDLRQQRGVHRSRNPIVMRVLRDLGWARDQGEGMRRIFGAMRQVELDVPELEERADTFIVRLSTRSVYDDLTQAWLAAFGPFGLQPEDRKYLFHLREAGGVLSVDKLARALGESYDTTKKHLARLERQGFVWHKAKTRTYRLVAPDSVLHERAWRVLSADSDPAALASARFTEPQLAELSGISDKTTFEALLNGWKQAGILRQTGKKSWRLASSFLAYAEARSA